jgi:hypothetical protein
MIAFGIVGFIFLAVAGACAHISGGCLLQEIAEVNRRLPDDKQISYWWNYPGKVSKISEHYLRFYPNGRLEFWRKTFEIAMIVSMAFVAVAGTLMMHIWRSLHGGN